MAKIDPAKVRESQGILRTSNIATDTEIYGSVSFRGRLYVYVHHKSLIAGMVLLFVILLLTIGAPLFAHYDPFAQDPSTVFEAPSVHHVMGTDEFGRDIFTRVLYGGRQTIFASIVVVCIGVVVGSILGLAAGMVGGVVDLCIMRTMDLLLAFPGILLALVVTTILGSGLSNAIAAIGIASIPMFARVAQGGTLEARSLSYTEAAVALGAGRIHIIRRHILPSVRSVIIVLATSWLGIGTLWVAALGFLGLGLQPPIPEWGASLNEGSNYVTIAWWLSIFPGLFISAYVVASNLIGDGLRDVIDPTVVNH
jgi:peptide/nickel transport system permease protein